MNADQRFLLEKLAPAACKLVTYMGGYLQQDHGAPDGNQELKAGLKLVLKVFTGILAGHQTTSHDPLQLADDEKYTIYGLFDGLNFLFGLADFKAIEVIVGNELFEGLLVLCQLDAQEVRQFERAEISNEFY